jgi:hypothetical protein
MTWKLVALPERVPYVAAKETSEVGFHHITEKPAL